eukprot:scaffold5036_cov155-Pinguiococcus_pyrenoidosus.AAC.3
MELPSAPPDHSSSSDGAKADESFTASRNTSIISFSFSSKTSEPAIRQNRERKVSFSICSSSQGSEPEQWKAISSALGGAHSEQSDGLRLHDAAAYDIAGPKLRPDGAEGPGPGPTRPSRASWDPWVFADTSRRPAGGERGRCRARNRQLPGLGGRNLVCDPPCHFSSRCVRIKVELGSKQLMT